MTIEEIKQLVNQKIIENYTGDITAGDVNRILNETLDKVGGQETKVNQLALEMPNIDEEHHIMTYKGVTYMLIGIDNEPIYSGAICGRAICGTAICGQL